MTNFVPCFTQTETTRAGLELSMSGELDKRSRYRFSWTHFTRLAGVVSGARLSDQTPHNVAEVTLHHGVGRYTLTGAAKYIQKYNGAANGSIGAVPYAGYSKFDAGLGYDWRWNDTPIRTTFYGRNLADRKYGTAVGIQDVGRVLGLEVLATF